MVTIVSACLQSTMYCTTHAYSPKQPSAEPEQANFIATQGLRDTMRDNLPFVRGRLVKTAHM